MKRKKCPLLLSTRLLIVLFALLVILNILSWTITPFSDWYANTVFPAISRIGSRLCDLFEHSVGEVLIAIGIALIPLGLVSYIVLMIVRKSSRWRITKIYGRILGWILLYIALTETLDCFMLYHTTPWAQTYYTESAYTDEDLLELYASLSEQANALSAQVSRDEDGHFQLSCDVNAEAKEALHALGEVYPLFAGDYPDAKTLRASYLMSQAHLTGIYFPFTLEANINGDMTDINYPDTVCHELVHLRGRIREDEAGFLSYKACMLSDCADFRYSGTIAALEYVQNAAVENQIAGRQEVTDAIDALVKNDMFSFLPDDYWEQKDEETITLVATETVHQSAQSAMDTSLKLNGVEDGVKSYSDIVTLLLDDYFADTN